MSTLMPPAELDRLAASSYTWVARAPSGTPDSWSEQDVPESWQVRLRGQHLLFGGCNWLGLPSLLRRIWVFRTEMWLGHWTTPSAFWRILGRLYYLRALP